MSDYVPPLAAIRRALDQAGLAGIARLNEADGEAESLADAILDEAARFAVGELAPLNTVGDRTGSSWRAGEVVTPPGWSEAYGRFRNGGWPAVTGPSAFGGQALPLLIGTALGEIWQAANMAFALGPLLTLGGVELLAAHGTEAQKRDYLPRLISGEWMATMNLTEPQAGSDLSQVRTRAEPTGGGVYRLRGQKIFISYGDHDLTDNIVHLVLARLPDSPEGTKGISLFVVPKYRLTPEGEPGERNGVACASLEHKMGIHGSPTAVIVFGEGVDAVGELVGRPGEGLACMFTMMNNARLGVGVQGLAIAERAFQRARTFAAERVQGRGPEGPATLDAHPDVQRMLMTMAARIAAARGILYLAAAQLDRAHGEADAEGRAAAQRLGDLLIPIAKAWSTQVGCEVADLSIQVHGGMGYIEETGAAQDYRDARILPIYEGTNGIQALDLLHRKVLRDGGETARRLFGLIGEELSLLAGDPVLAGVAASAQGALHRLRGVTRDLLARTGDRIAIEAAASPYLQLFALVLGCWITTRNAAGAAVERDPDALRTALFFAAHLLPQAEAFAEIALADTAMFENPAADRIAA